MNAATDTVDLLSFAPEPETYELQRALTGLGYATDVLSRGGWESDLRCCSPLVLFLGDGEYPRQRLSSLLEGREATPTVGIFERENFAVHSVVLNRCTDFLAWPSHHEEVALRLRRAGIAPPADSGEGHRRLRERFAELNLLGASPAFVQVLELISRVARSDAPVLIQGQTGTGKELVARAIHDTSLRLEHPFVPVNCGALPDNLVENELFGHERGAFTDAKTSQQGLIAQAEGGTLFLDEVDALCPKAQVALLRFLQDREFKPLGGSRARKADVRIVAATHEPLEDLVRRGEFRQDLMFRLNILLVNLPPLAAREGDIELLAHHFIRQHSRRYVQPSKGIHPQALEWMNAYHWPGNVRELENLVHRAFVLSEGPNIELRHLLQAESGGAVDAAGDVNSPFEESFQDAKARIVERFEKQYLTWIMQETGGNVSLAARRAGKERRCLGKLLKKHGIHKGRFMQEAVSMAM